MNVGKLNENTGSMDINPKLAGPSCL
jgi:hypothetical protein